MAKAEPKTLVAFKATRRDHARITREARRRGLTVSAYLREAVNALAGRSLVSMRDGRADTRRSREEVGRG